MKKTTAIIIDSYVDSLEVLSDLLGILDLDIVGTESNYTNAISLFKKYKPDLVFVDLSSSNSARIQSIEEIKRQRHSSKIIVLTADANCEAIELLDKSIINAVLLKPFSIESIRQILEDELNIKVAQNYKSNP